MVSVAEKNRKAVHQLGGKFLEDWLVKNREHKLYITITVIAVKRK